MNGRYWVSLGGGLLSPSLRFSVFLFGFFALISDERERDVRAGETSCTSGGAPFLATTKGG
ncbi:hypothetical protein Hanom_Chr00s000001g01594131 [Helianthus anomalus]